MAATVKLELVPTGLSYQVKVYHMMITMLSFLIDDNREDIISGVVDLKLEQQLNNIVEYRDLYGLKEERRMDFLELVKDVRQVEKYAAPARRTHAEVRRRARDLLISYKSYK